MIFFLFLLGLIIGSFLNVLIYRLNEEHVPKFWQGRSFCPKCKHQLAWVDNIPLLSFALLGGKCRYCHKKISWRYPLVELVTALVTVTINLNPFYLTIAYCLIVIFFSDAIYGLIPDEMTVILGILGLLGNLGNWENVKVGVGAFLVLLVVYAVTSGRGIGFGDVKLIFPLGLLLGWPKILVMAYATSIGGGLYAGSLLLLKRKKFGETIALGPFLVVGSVIAWLVPVSL